ncbi:unnamed protein product [Rodentolepis nana]|uniref:Velvet domain-containing protein n=1 Tax=Rodentolepis nana TaxID=102285 RepID=A0A0R3TZT1_RODNA|nr:unnamed protein product [Rodentolepis nana]
MVSRAFADNWVELHDQRSEFYCDSVSREFRPTIATTTEFQTLPPLTPQPLRSSSAQLFPPRSPPPVPPHRNAHNYDTELVFLQPENRPLIPPSYPMTLPPIPNKSQPEDAQKRNSRFSPVLAHHRGPSDVMFVEMGTPAPESTLFPTPKPRNRYVEDEEMEIQIMGKDDQGEWLCRDDMKYAYKPPILISPYFQRYSTQTPSNYRISNRYTKQHQPYLTRCTSAEYFGTSPVAGGIQQKPIGSPQQYRSMANLNFYSPEFSPGVIEREVWLLPHNEQTRLTNSGRVLSLSSGALHQEIIKRPICRDADIRSSRIWRPMNIE